MQAIGKIGVIIPDVFDSLEQELIQGIYMYAKEIGYDVLVFCDTCNKNSEYSDFPEVKGYRNINQLLLQADFDGVLFCAERILDAAYRDELNKSLQKLSVPCLAIGWESDCFPSILSSQKESIYLMTKHLIEEHNCRNLYCLTGFPNEKNSMERVQGFSEAMAEFGLTTDDSMIFYGDFWKEKPRQLGKDIADGKIPKPDGIVCASDPMAIALCEGLIENGISVPEDISVTGYDGSWNAFLESPKITTICGREEQLGFMAARSLHKMMNGEYKEEIPIPQQYIRYGTSCGCMPYLKNNDRRIEKYIHNKIDRCYAQKIFTPSNFSDHVTNANTLDELIYNICCFSHLLQPIREYDICLCEDWRFDFNDTAAFREYGFSEDMFVALKLNADITTESNINFMCRDLLPDLKVPHEPRISVFTSLHHKSQIFGYIATTYYDARDIGLDEHYMNWCNAVSNGLDSLQKRQYREYINRQVEALSDIDPMTGFLNKRGLLERLSDFSSRYIQREQRFLCAMITYVYKNEVLEQIGSDSDMVIANALRLSTIDGEVLCRLQDNVFALLMPFHDVNADDTLQKRIMQLEQKIEYVHGSIPQLSMPLLITDYSLLNFKEIGNAGVLIDEKIKTILYKVEASAKMAGNCKDELQSLRRRIYASPQDKWSITDVSRTTGMSVGHFRRMYKTEFGVGFKDDVIDARLEKAKQLLLHTDLRVQEIADVCGYSDCTHFMRQFKDKTGVTALQYRNQK